MNAFYQTPPMIDDPYTSDDLLRSYLSRFFNPQDFGELEKKLEIFSQRLTTDIAFHAQMAHDQPPQHRPFDPWGKRIDEIIMSPSWEALARFSAEEGLVSDAYTRIYGKNSRLVQFAKIFLFHPASSFFTCPLAMTDGAARLIELYGDDELKKKAFVHLTSQDPDLAWTSGQWMTERTGGSDVSNTETIARFEDGVWRLYGTKWFTSAITSEMAMALARIEENGQTVAGTKGLGLFYIEIRNQQGALNHIKVLRLKDKLGTKALPTAELELQGTPAHMVAPRGAGVKTISALFNITRIYNACTTIGSYKRLLNLSLSYAKQRHAFKQPLIEHPLHQQTLSKLEVDYHALFHLTFYVARLQGIEECNPDEHHSKLLRLLTPIAKLMSAKINMVNTSELIETFGGAGYIEDTGLPRFLRDAQVFCIWEGTTNVLSLDVLRALNMEQAITAFKEEVRQRIKLIKDPDFADHKESYQKILSSIDLDIAQLEEVDARDFAWSLGQVICGLNLIDHAQATNNSRYKLIALKYHERKLWTPKTQNHQDNKAILGL